jgi:hypothetical protein
VEDRDYEVPFEFTGKLSQLTIELKRNKSFYTRSQSNDAAPE